MELVYPHLNLPVLPLPTANKPGVPLTIGEILPVVEPSGLVIGKTSRSCAHGGTMVLHPVVHLHILGRDCKLLLQKRSKNKDLLPGYWDTAVGGHVNFGEYVREALVREASEELGLKDFNPTALCSYVWESPSERELVSSFACVGKYELTPNPEEVEEIRFWDLDEIETSLGEGLFTPNFEYEFPQIRGTLVALL